MKRIILLLTFTALFAAVSHSIPAKRGFVEYTRPDGSVIKIIKIGDEHGHRIYSEEGRLLIEKDGRLAYSDEDETEWVNRLEINRSARIEKQVKASLTRLQVSRQNEGEGVISDSINKDEANHIVPLNFGRCDVSFPVLGKQKGLVILVEYQDVKFSYGDYDYFNRMLNEEGFSDFGSLGSARDWFIDNSNGKFLPEFDVFGPVELSNDRSYYGKNDSYGNDKQPHLMAIEACQLLDDQIDFTQYDRDEDGIIDNVFIFYAGVGEHDSNVSTAVWPHSWDVSSAIPGKDYTFDGVRLDHYACTCEHPNNYKRPDGIGTFVHEFSHVMGLPDLYVTTNSNGFTPGEWDVLDYGPYNNDGLTPPNYSSWEKHALGWIEYLPLTEGKIELPDFSSSNIAYALPTEKNNEFFFFENRQQRGNDQFLPGHGMLVWHIDYKKNKWEANEVNNLANHQYADIVEADDNRTDNTRDGDSFPGKNNVTSFGFDTTPQLASWDKQRLAFDLQDISESPLGIITFNAIRYFSDPQDSVEEIFTRPDSDSIQYYDLMGRKVIHPSKGIFIHNGKKVIINL